MKYKYADLADVMEAIRAPLSENGLSITHRMSKSDRGTYALETILMHESGQTISTWYPLPDPGLAKPQTFGGLLTYGRRYSVCALVGVASDDDIDGALDDKAGEPRAEKKPQTAKPASTAQPTSKAPVKNEAPASKTQISKIANLAEDRKIEQGELGFFLKWCYPGVNSSNMKQWQALEILALLEEPDTSSITLMSAGEKAKTQAEARQV